MKIKDAIKNGKIPNVKIESIFQSLERLGINVSKNSRTAEYDLEDKIIDKLRIYINASISFNKYNNEVNNEIKTTHNDLMSKYDSLINKYKNIIKKLIWNCINMILNIYHNIFKIWFFLNNIFINKFHFRKI